MEKRLFKKTIVFIQIFSLIGLGFNSSISGFTIEKISEEKSNTFYGDLKVHFIDVGQGDSILIQTPENNFVLIDTGSRSFATTVIDYLYSLSVTTIKAFIATHPHEDHIGGSQEIFDAFDILSVYHTGYPYSSQTYQRFLNSAENEGCPIYTDEDVDPGDYIDISNSLVCQILHINKDASNANDAGIVLMLSYYEVNYLFTGDIHGEIEDKVEYYLVDNWYIDVDILKVAHHGSRYSSVDYFLNEATPEVSIISVGEGNPYGHPHYEALYRLESYNSLIFRTDINGDIIISTDGWSYNIIFEKPEDNPTTPIVDGPEVGEVGVEHMFSAKSFDSNGDLLYYMWDWGDGNVTDWKGEYYPGVEIYEYHTFSQKGAYVIKVKAKDTNGYESDWGYLNVLMPKIRPTKTLYFGIFSNFLILKTLINFLKNNS
jgi:competence protein ComEC